MRFFEIIIIKIFCQSEQKNDTRNGTLRSINIPCIIAIKTISFPEYCVITGSVVSIVVAPPAHIGAKRPKNLTNMGAPIKAIISRIINDCVEFMCLSNDF